MCCITVHINLLLLCTENSWDMTLGLVSMTYFLGFWNICPKRILFSSAFWTHVFFIWGWYYFYCGNVLILLKGESSKNCKPNIIPLIQQVRTIFNQQLWVKCLTILLESCSRHANANWKSRAHCEWSETRLKTAWHSSISTDLKMYGLTYGYSC